MVGTRWRWVVLLASGTLMASSGPWQGSGPDWLDVNGEDWRRMEPDVRLAYVEASSRGPLWVRPPGELQTRRPSGKYSRI
jgi:hypothetical protein